MSPKHPGAPKKPRWTQAKKAAARKADSSGTDARGPVRSSGARGRSAPAHDPRRRFDGERPRTDRRETGREDARVGFRRDDDARNRGGYRGRDERDADRGFRRDDRSSTRVERDRPRFSRDDRSGDDRRSGRPERASSWRDARHDGRGRQDREVRGGYGWRDDAQGRGRDERSEGRRQGRDRDAGRDRSGYPRRDDRGGYTGRDDRGGYGGRDDRGGYGGRDDRGGFGGRGRDDRGGYGRRDERGGFGGRVRGGFGGRDDRGGFGRRDDRGGRDERRGYQGRDDRGRFADREDRGGFVGRGDQGRDERRGYRGRDDRGPGARRDGEYRPRWNDRGEDRPYGDRGGRPERFDRDSRPVSRPRPESNAGDQGAGGVRETAPRTHHRPPADAPAVRGEHLHRKEAPPAEPVDLETNGFAVLGVPEPLVRRLARDGITAPFPIQEATIPDALAGRDVLGRGRTGSGKTLAFGLPLLARLAQGERATPNRPRAIVLSPTRELAMQISDALQPLVHVMGLRHKLVAGGMPYPPQFDALDRGVDLLVATPGRLTDLIDRGACTLEGCELVVLDEADHMADMGFLPEITVLLDQVPAGGQRLLFSATLDKGIDTLVETYLNDPVTHSTDEAQASVTTMAHHILLVEPAHKKVVTAHVANRGGHTIVFVRTKLGADRVAMQLREEGVFAAALHGGLNQNARNRVLNAFKDGTIPVLVATDVAARGIHVDDVGLVMQVDPPADHKDYLHRAGRTARAGEQGTVVTLALPHQKRQMQRLADQAGLDVTPEKVAPGDDRLQELTGASRPSGHPVPEERLRRLLEPPARPRGGYRGRSGGGYRGGRR